VLSERINGDIGLMQLSSYKQVTSNQLILCSNQNNNFPVI
jgi:hypothetical protein